MREVLIDGLFEREGEDGRTVTERLAVGARILIQIRHDERAHRHLHSGAVRTWQETQPGIVVRNEGADGATEIFAQQLDGAEKEAAIRLQRPTQAAAELVACEGWLLGAIEIVAGIEGVVAMVFIGAAGVAVGARLGEDVDLSTGVAAELGTVGVDLDAELAHALEPERKYRQHSRQARS